MVTFNWIGMRACTGNLARWAFACFWVWAEGNEIRRPDRCAWQDSPRETDQLEVLPGKCPALSLWWAGYISALACTCSTVCYTHAFVGSFPASVHMQAWAFVYLLCVCFCYLCSCVCAYSWTCIYTLVIRIRVLYMMAHILTITKQANVCNQLHTCENIFCHEIMLASHVLRVPEYVHCAQAVKLSPIIISFVCKCA